MKDQIFISHATPEDNDFTIWLASRLEMRGYDVWIDKTGLLGGERFWPTIQKAICSSRKVLLVYSNNIVRDGILKVGIENEIEFAKSLAFSKKDTEFVIPLHIDDSPYHLAIGLPNINQIPFSGNWAQGLGQLLKKLDKDGVQYESNVNSTISAWYETVYSTNSKIENKKELYYTSWWSVKSVPNIFYMYKFNNKEQATYVKHANKSIPLAQLSNIVSSFDHEITFDIVHDNQRIKVTPQKVYSFSLDEILFGFESNEFPTHKDVENHFKDFLRYLIYEIFNRNGFIKTYISNKRPVYYLPANNNKFNPIPFFYKYSSQHRPKKKSLGGKFKEKWYWHYGISILPILYPFIGVSLKSHLIFTKDGKNVIDKDSVQHSYRRSKGRSFFNEQWRDLLIAFLSFLKNKNGDIEIPVTKEGLSLKMKLYPETFWSDYGYKDPSHTMNENDIENLPEDDDFEQ